MKKLAGLNNPMVQSLLIFLLLPSTSIAKNYYVDQNHSSASDSNPGTIEAPWSTIRHAAETLTASDTVFIRSGTYNESVYFDNAGNSTEGHIVYSAFPGETPIVDGISVTESNNGIIIDKDYIKLHGLTIRNWNENGIWIENASFFEISDCIVHDIFYGIGVADGSHDFVFNSVTVHHFDLYGFDVSTSGGADCYNGTFNDCLAHTGRDSQQNVDGFALGHGTQHNFEFNRCKTFDVYDGFDISSQNTTLNRCMAYNCWNGAYKLWQDNVKLVNCIGYSSGGSNVELDWDQEPGVTKLINCTFFDAQTFSIWIENAADTLEMYNCIIAGGDNIGLTFEQQGVGNYRGDYNIFHNDNPDRLIAVGYTDEFTANQVIAGDWSNYSGQDAHSIVANSAESLFVNPAQNDLHLVKNSPAIDSGTSISAPSTDFDGNLRPFGSTYDIGAYEYQTSVDVLIVDKINDPPKSLLVQNYPNPFNPSTEIKFYLHDPNDVNLEVYNTLGKRIKTLLKKRLNAGHHEVIFNAQDLSSGIYFYRIHAGAFQDVKKMILIR